MYPALLAGSHLLATAQVLTIPDVWHPFSPNGSRVGIGISGFLMISHRFIPEGVHLRRVQHSKQELR